MATPTALGEGHEEALVAVAVGEQAHDEPRRVEVERREGTTHRHQPPAIHRDGVDHIVEAPTRREAGVGGPIGIEAAQVDAHRAIQRCEGTTHQQPPIRLQSHAVDVGWHGTACELWPIAGVQGATGLQAHQSLLRGAVETVEGSAHDQLPSDRHHRTHHRFAAAEGEAAAGIEGGIKGAVAVESGDTSARGAVHRAEVAANDDLAIRLGDDGLHRIVEPQAGVEGRVGGAVRAQAQQSEVPLTRRCGEPPGDECLAVCLLVEGPCRTAVRLPRREGGVNDDVPGRGGLDRGRMGHRGHDAGHEGEEAEQDHARSGVAVHGAPPWVLVWLLLVVAVDVDEDVGGGAGAVVEGDLPLR